MAKFISLSLTEVHNVIINTDHIISVGTRGPNNLASVRTTKEVIHVKETLKEVEYLLKEQGE